MLGSLIGPIINAGAGLLGAAMAPDYNPAKDFKQVFKAKMKMGDRFGISKLIMAGVPPGISQPQDNSVGQAVANMGADIGNAISRHMTRDQKVAQTLQLENAAAQNELIKAQTRNINMRTVREAVPPRPPAMAVPGLGPLGQRMEPPSQTTHGVVGGVRTPFHPGMMDAASAENRWGETISDWGYGPLVALADLYYWSQQPGMNPAASDQYVPLDRSKLFMGSSSTGGGF